MYKWWTMKEDSCNRNPNGRSEMNIEWHTENAACSIAIRVWTVVRCVVLMEEHHALIPQMEDGKTFPFQRTLFLTTKISRSIELNSFRNFMCRSAAYTMVGRCKFFIRTAAIWNGCSHFVSSINKWTKCVCRLWSVLDRVVALKRADLRQFNGMARSDIINDFIFDATEFCPFRQYRMNEDWRRKIEFFVDKWHTAVWNEEVYFVWNALSVWC